MADTTTSEATAASPTPTDVSPPAGVVAPSTPAATHGAGLSNEFLAIVGLKDAAGAKPPTGKRDTPPAPLATDEEKPKLADPEDESADPDEIAEAAEVEAKLKAEKTPPWVSERLSKNAQQKKELRAELEAVKTAKAEAEKRIEELSANLPTLQPSSPLAHLATQELFEKEADAVTDFLTRANEPEAASRYKDYDEDTGTSAIFENDKAYATYFLKNQKAHAAILKARQASTEAVKTAVPSLFDGKSEDFQFRQTLHQNDPRTLPDFEQIIADATRGRRERLEEAAGKVRYTRTDLSAAKTTTPKVKETLPVFTPQTTRSPVTPADAPNSRDSLMAKAKSGPGVSLETLMGTLAR